MAPTFAEATAVKATGPHTYEGNFPTEWCIGSGQSLILEQFNSMEDITVTK